MNVMWCFAFAIFVAGISARTIITTEEENSKNGTTPSGCKCEKRYWAHYEGRGCNPVFDEDNSDCPIRFDCPNNETRDPQKCLVGGQYYDIGSKINSTEPCKQCYCHNNSLTVSPSLNCLIVECPGSFSGMTLGEGCRYVYEKDSCCAVGTKCETNEVPVCNWNNRTYLLGQRIYPEDPCFSCICTEDWDGLSSCQKRDCAIDNELQRGCVPIYHNSHCCPIEYHCPETTQENNAGDIEPSTVNKDENECYFNGTAINRGDTFDMPGANACVTCTCCVPPDLTCIHNDCPPRPEEYENCRAVYKKETCCPEYECSDHSVDVETDASIERNDDRREVEAIMSPNDESPCVDINCEDGERCQLRQICEESSCRTYPQCVFINPNCPTPLCDTGCYIVNMDKDRCPTCSCDNNTEYRKDTNEICVLPNCTGRNCHLVSNKDGCPVCSCDAPCPPCPSTCQVESDIPEGRCPECICNELDEKKDADDDTTEVNVTSDNVANRCPVPHCYGYDCQIFTGNNGCPLCVCKSKCPPTKCISGCFVDKDPSPNTCPGCICYVPNSTKASAEH